MQSVGSLALLEGHGSSGSHQSHGNMEHLFEVLGDTLVEKPNKLWIDRAEVQGQPTRKRSGGS